jgi:hypothetical protein
LEALEKVSVGDLEGQLAANKMAHFFSLRPESDAGIIVGRQRALLRDKRTQRLSCLPDVATFCLRPNFGVW